MSPDLTDRDEAKFAKLREELEGVTRSEPEPEGLDAAPGPLDPMLAQRFDGTLAELDADEWIAEQKYDGTRILLEKFDGEVSLFTRRHVERSDTLTELREVTENVLPDGIVLDGEYTFLDPEGVSRFLPVHAAGDTAEEEDLTPEFFAFDVLATDHSWCTRDPLEERKARLAEVVPQTELLRVVEPRRRNFGDFFDDLTERGEEGIIVKRRSSAYHAGTRSVHWRKVKAFRETDLIAVGYTPGEGSRAETFGALVLTDGERYVGRVGSGFTRDELEELREFMEATDTHSVPESTVGNPYVPVEPFVVQVKFQEVTHDGELRAPVYLRRRPEKPLDDVRELEK